jgi:hypothetical protein
MVIIMAQLLCLMWNTPKLNGSNLSFLIVLSNTLLPIILSNMRKARRFSGNELDIKKFFATLRNGGFKDISG